VRVCILLLAVFFSLSYPIQAQVTEEAIEELMDLLIEASGEDLGYILEIDDSEDMEGSHAAVERYEGEEDDYYDFILYIEAAAMDTESVNDWAFILGHELAHVIEGHIDLAGPAVPSQEMTADVLGATLAMAIGADLVASIQRSLELNECSISHGCDVERAYVLVEVFELDISQFNIPEYHEHSEEW